MHIWTRILLLDVSTLVGLTLAGELGIWVTMHIIVFASFYAYNSNRDRESIIGNSYKVTLEHDILDESDDQLSQDNPVHSGMLHGKENMY